MRNRKSTIYDLARLADVSATTVSSVLSGNWRERRIAEDTAQRVIALAAEHRFSVNRQASGLRTSRSGLIGMIIPLHDNRFFSGTGTRNGPHADLLSGRVPDRRRRDRSGRHQRRLPQP